MGENREIVDSFKAMLNIIENTLSGKEVPFRVVDFVEDDKIGVYAMFDLDGERFYITPDINGSKVWVTGFPVENTGVTGLDSGYAGFPTEVAGVIDQYYREKPKGPIQHFDGIGDLGTLNLNETIRQEVRKALLEFDYAAAEREYADKEYYRQDIEAEVSTALSFMQDMRGSINKLRGQKGLGQTNSNVDGHIEEAINHINEAIQVYLENMSPDAKSAMTNRMGEVNIEE